MVGVLHHEADLWAADNGEGQRVVQVTDGITEVYVRDRLTPSFELGLDEFPISGRYLDWPEDVRGRWTLGRGARATTST